MENHGLKATRKAALTVRQRGSVEVRAHVVENGAAGRVEGGQLGRGSHGCAVDIRAAHVQLGAVVRGEEATRDDVARAKTGDKHLVRRLPDLRHITNLFEEVERELF